MPTSFERLKAALSDRYEIEREVGHGAMATVYLAKDRKHNRNVAVKVLLTEVGFALGPERFRREIELASHLSHPHILPIYDSGDADGELYYVMPYVAGESLRARLNRERQLPVDEALRITCEVASALDHSHRHDIIHRDIKPENILLEDGQALVADFGIARAVSKVGEEKLTSTGISLGTPTYMSPEQGMADPNLDRRSDIYSLGCVLYEMLAGQPPFTGRTTQALLARHSLDNVPSLSIIRNTIPEEVEDAIMRSLAKVPADRFSTAAEFADALRSCQTGTYVVRRTGRHTGAQRVKKRNWRTVGFTAALALFVLSVVAWAGKAFLWDKPLQSVRGAGVEGFPAQRLGILYFKDQSPDKSLAYLADGMTESLIEELGRVSALDVISAGGVKEFRGKEVPRDSIARALAAGTLIEGTVAQEGSNVRVMMRLVDGNTGVDFDASPVIEPLGDPLALRTKLVERLAVMLREWLRDEIRLRELRAGTENPTAWSLVQRAEKLRKDAEALGQAGDTARASRQLWTADTLLAQAEALDSRWVEPIVLRGQIALRREVATHDPIEAGKWINIGMAHAERAVALDSRDSDALELRGTLHTRPIANGLVNDKRQHDDMVRAAERDLRAAIASNPAQAGALYQLSMVQYSKGEDPIEAHNLARRAYEADAYLSAAPQILYSLYSTSYDLEQVTNAQRWCDELKRRFPKELHTAKCQLWVMTTKAFHPPDVREAWRRAADYERVAGPEEREYFRREGQIVVASVLARAGLSDSARRVLVRARADQKVDPRGELIGFEAFVRTMLGDKDEAVNLLQRYLTNHPEHRDFAKTTSWWWRDLQSDPRFKSLIAEGG